MTLSTAYAQWAGKNLVQEACSGTTGSAVVWSLVLCSRGGPGASDGYHLVGCAS